MQNEHNTQFDSQPQPASTETQADKEWSELQRDLDMLGRQLAELATHSAALGEHFLSNLQAHFQEVKTHAFTYKQATEEQLDQVRQAAWQQAQETEGAFNEARTRTTEAARDAARQMWERSEPFRQGAKDVGEGLVRAWGELRTSIGKAAGRLNTEPSSTTNGPVPPTTNEPRETT
jgi:hypothetical protein